MARKTMKRKTTRRRRNSSINLLNLAQSAVVANATTQGLFGVNLAEFITGRTNGKFIPGADGYAKITLPELLGFRQNGWSLAGVGGNYGNKTFLDGVNVNFDKNGARMIATLIAAPIAFKVGSKLTAAPRRSANRLLDMAGLKSVVKV